MLKIELNKNEARKFLAAAVIVMPSRRFFGILKPTSCKLIDNLDTLKTLIARYENAEEGKSKAMHEKMLIRFLKMHN